MAAKVGKSLDTHLYDVTHIIYWWIVGMCMCRFFCAPFTFISIKCSLVIYHVIHQKFSLFVLHKANWKYWRNVMKQLLK